VFDGVGTLPVLLMVEPLLIISAYYLMKVLTLQI
jgi:hypothetical protein